MASERSRRCFILPFAASARRMSRPANISATRATTKLSESFRRFVQSVPNLLPVRSAVRSIARIARIAFSISTPPSPPIAAAESFAAWFSISNTAGKCIFAICWDAGFLAALNDARLRDQHFDIIVPVPLHPARERERGFNQAALLANLVSRQMSIRSKALLERTRYTTTQTAFDRAERMENLRGAFRLRRGADVRELRVLLIDDVLTTGSTVSECARVLKKGRRDFGLRGHCGARLIPWPFSRNRH